MEPERRDAAADRSRSPQAAAPARPGRGTPGGATSLRPLRRHPHQPRARVRRRDPRSRRPGRARLPRPHHRPGRLRPGQSDPRRPPGPRRLPRRPPRHQRRSRRPRTAADGRRPHRSGNREQPRLRSRSSRLRAGRRSWIVWPRWSTSTATAASSPRRASRPWPTPESSSASSAPPTGSTRPSATGRSRPSPPPSCPSSPSPSGGPSPPVPSARNMASCAAPRHGESWRPTRSNGGGEPPMPSSPSGPSPRSTLRTATAAGARSWTSCWKTCSTTWNQSP